LQTFANVLRILQYQLSGIFHFIESFWMIKKIWVFLLYSSNLNSVKLYY